MRCTTTTATAPSPSARRRQEWRACTAATARRWATTTADGWIDLFVASRRRRRVAHHAARPPPAVPQQRLRHLHRGGRRRRGQRAGEHRPGLREHRLRAGPHLRRLRPGRRPGPVRPPPSATAPRRRRCSATRATAAFREVTDSSGVVGGMSRGLSPRFSDMDGDGYPELLLAADYGTSPLLPQQRQRHLQRLDRALRHRPRRQRHGQRGGRLQQRRPARLVCHLDLHRCGRRGDTRHRQHALRQPRRPPLRGALRRGRGQGRRLGLGRGRGGPGPRRLPGHRRDQRLVGAQRQLRARVAARAQLPVPQQRRPDLHRDLARERPSSTACKAAAW